MFELVQDQWIDGMIVIYMVDTVADNPGIKLDRLVDIYTDRTAKWIKTELEVVNASATDEVIKDAAVALIEWAYNT